MISDMDENSVNNQVEVDDTWGRFIGDDVEPVTIAELASIDLGTMPPNARVPVMDDYFPDTTIHREGGVLICSIEEHLYTKYWEHKFSAYAFAEAMERAIRRLANEGHPVANPIRDDDDVHIFVRWEFRIPAITPLNTIGSLVKAAYELVWQRADSILENSDSVLILGKDTGPGLAKLKRIAERLENLGYYTYIIKEQPDKPGESVVQKVMRYALSSKFVIIENTDASGHLYEVPHVTKAAECITVVLQEDGKGATWMFEDAYAKHKHWHRIKYINDNIEDAAQEAASWAERFFKEFAEYQASKLPWLQQPVATTSS